jgi:hypothetical protein
VSTPSGESHYSLIVPISLQFSHDYDAARRILSDRLPGRWISTYSRRPSTLFTGVGVRSTIVTGRRDSPQQLNVSDTRRWQEDFRPFLFDTARFSTIEVESSSDPWPRVGHDDLARLWRKLTSTSTTLGDEASRSGPYKFSFKTTGLYFLSTFVEEPPAWDLQGKLVPQSEVQAIYFGTEEIRDIAFAIVSGRIGFWWWGAIGDDFHVTKTVFNSFPISPADLDASRNAIVTLSRQLQGEQPRHPVVTKKAGKYYGNYDPAACREITDEIDQIVLSTLGMEEFWPAILLSSDLLLKSTGEGGGSQREWPFPWSPKE